MSMGIGEVHACVFVCVCVYTNTCVKVDTRASLLSVLYIPSFQNWSKFSLGHDPVYVSSMGLK